MSLKHEIIEHIFQVDFPSTKSQSVTFWGPVEFEINEESVTLSDVPRRLEIPMIVTKSVLQPLVRLKFYRRDDHETSLSLLLS